VSFERIGAGLTPYPFLLIFPQDEHERLLIARLEALGVTVERKTTLLGFVDEPDCVTARLRTPDGREEKCEARFIAGCDGARSLVRDTMKTGFPGGTYRQVFYVADVDAAGPPLDGELHIDLDEADFLAVFPLVGEGRARLVGIVRDDRADQLKFEDVSDRAISHLRVEVKRVNWFSTYRVHHRVTDHFREGRAFVLGDAAHIHSPVGGQGMNTGIGDAINLAWKLAAMLAGRGSDALLDSYAAERSAFARRLVKTTDRVFTFATAEGRIADILRTRIAPFLMPKLLSIPIVRQFLFRTVSQITLNYRGGFLSQGRSGRVHGGDRLPWVIVDGRDNFESLAAMTWQIHVYGAAHAKLAAWCANHAVALHEFDWHAAYGEAGLARDAAYLLRPDSYVALAGATPDSLDDYFQRRGIRP
jgi:2-polyprenyl-6-methoxyphenol hydroxylase-like FAD-dependent oxidoreductase